MIKGIWKTRKVFINEQELNPFESQNVVNHSPDGFMWGYGGSGPAQLALAILMEFTDKLTADRLHQGFKWKFIASLKQEEDFTLDETEVIAWIDENRS